MPDQPRDTEYAYVRGGFANKVRFFSPGENTRLTGEVSLSSSPSVRVNFEVFRKQGVHAFALTIHEGRYEGDDALCLARMVEHAKGQARQFAEDLNFYERNPNAYLDKIDLYLRTPSARNVQLTLPMLPLSLTGEMSGILIHRLIASGLFGDLTSRENLLTRDSIFVQALRSILGRMPAVAVAGDEFLMKVMQALPPKPRANSTMH